MSFTQRSIVIILTLFFIVVLFFVGVYLVVKRSTRQAEINRAGNILEQRTNEIENKINKIREEAKDRSYTQEEVDFILNPAGEKLQVENAKTLSPEEINAILNPIKTTETPAADNSGEKNIGQASKPLNQAEIDAILNP